MISDNEYESDLVLEAEDYKTSSPDGAVLIRTSVEGEASLTPISIPTAFKHTAEKYPKRIALAEEENGRWKKITFKNYRELVLVCAKAFIKLGLKRFHSVCIIGFNSPEWLISNLAAIHAGGFACGIYTTNSAETTKHCIETSLGTIAVVEDKEQVSKILSIKEKLPNLSTIIQYKQTSGEKGVLSWDDLINIGKNESGSELEERLKKIAVNQCAQLVFTSGTTGKPKAIMLSHDNIMSCSFTVGSYMKIRDHEKVVSYLPLSHVAAAAVDIYLTLFYGGSTYFAAKDALKGSLVKTLMTVKPTRFIAVPRVWEKIYEKLNDNIMDSSSIKKSIFTWSMSTLLKANWNKINGLNTGTSGLKYTFAKVLLKKVKRRLGFSRCKSFISAAAPLNSDILQFFLSIDIPISMAYGLSETTGAHTLNLDFKNGSVGKSCPGYRSKIHKMNREGEGEILLYGRDICMGYLNSKKQNEQYFVDNGWLCTGDLGKIDVEGFVYITGREKELIITAGGENIAPVPIEDRIKKVLPLVSQAVVVGEKEKFLTVLLTIKRNLKQGPGSDVLDDTVLSWCKAIGSSAKTIKEIVDHDPKVDEEIAKGLDKVNQYAVSRAQFVHKFKILPIDFSIQTEELGPTLKLKRNVIIEKYSKYINEMYGRN